MSVYDWPSLKMADGRASAIFVAHRRGIAGLSRLVVVRYPHEAQQADPKYRTEFIKQVRHAATIENPSVPRVLGILDEEELFVVEEYISGEDLAFIHKNAPVTHVPVGVSCRIILDVATALVTIHEPPLFLHGGICPSNIVVDYNGHAHLLDPGYAAADPHDVFAKRRTAYTSVEKLGHDTEDDHSDIFTLGVCFWEILCGRRLFESTTETALASKVMEQTVVSPHEINPRVPAQISHLVLEMLERDPEKRVQSARDLCHRLSTLVDTLSDSSHSNVAVWMRSTFAEAHQNRLDFEQRVAEGDALLSPATAVVALDRQKPSVSPPVLEGGSGSGNKIVLALFAALMVLGAVWLGLRASAQTSVRVFLEPIGAEIHVDGRFHGHGTNEGVLVEGRPGSEATLLVSSPGFESRTEHFSFPSSGSDSLRVELARTSPNEEPVAAAPSSTESEASAQNADEAHDNALLAAENHNSGDVDTHAAANDPGARPADPIGMQPSMQPSGMQPSGMQPSGGRVASQRQNANHIPSQGAMSPSGSEETAVAPPPAPPQRPTESSPPRPTLARVGFRSTPSSAEVFLDGRLMGRTPLAGVELTPGRRYSLRVTRNGFRPARLAFEAHQGANAPIDVTLQAEEAVAESPRQDVRVPRAMLGNATTGETLFRGCRSCHGQSAPTIGPGRYTASGWARYFASGRHSRHTFLSDRFNRSQLADVKAYLSNHAAGAATDVAAGVQ